MKKLILTKIPDLSIIKFAQHQDSRGLFGRLFCLKELEEWLQERKIVQMNHSITHRVGAVRGLHCQSPPFAEMKLVRCIKGRVFDVAVDMRPGSPTQYQWHGEELSEENNHLMIIPEGFLHGFQTLEPDSQLLYLHTAFYTPEAEGGIHPQDENLAIQWPLPISELSERDQNLPKIVCIQEFIAMGKDKKQEEVMKDWDGTIGDGL